MRLPVAASDKLPYLTVAFKRRARHKGIGPAMGRAKLLPESRRILHKTPKKSTQRLWHVDAAEVANPVVHLLGAKSIRRRNNGARKNNGSPKAPVAACVLALVTS